MCGLAVDPSLRFAVQRPLDRADIMMERSMTKFPTSLALGLLIISSGGAMAEQRTVTLAVDNMYCEACPYMVKKTIERVSGVSKITVSLKEKRQSLCSMMRGQRSKI
jgi:mercuric ion binding protein